jgi:putative sterol carrier protein
MPSLDEIFERMPGAFDAEKGKDVNATIQFDLTGDDGENYYLAIAGGEVNVTKGSAENPTATIIMGAEDFKQMIAGELRPEMAFMTGKIKVKGDLNTVMKFQSLFKV